MTDVIFSELLCSNNRKIGIIELNNPKALNALTLDMIRTLYQQLSIWESNQSICLVIIKGADDKAFCAGGDVVSLYKAINIKNHSNIVLSDEVILNHLCNDFFKEEYKLDLYIHEYKKPILAWGDGYVFGGGLGLFAGASHRITTERTIMAMPETAIGLYPDVGASWFLNKMPNRLGVFLGLTGAFFNASDAKYLGLSNFVIESNQKENVIDKLHKAGWSSEDNTSEQLDLILKGFESGSLSAMPISAVQLNEDLIVSIMSSNSIDTIYNKIVHTVFENKWLKEAQNKLCRASILSIYITYTQLELTKNHAKSECFTSELNLSLRCSQYTEFPEGVRAQLVDKDKSPQWKFKHINEVGSELILWFFTQIKKR